MHLQCSVRRRWVAICAAIFITCGVSRIDQLSKMRHSTTPGARLAQANALLIQDSLALIAGCGWCGSAMHGDVAGADANRVYRVYRYVYELDLLGEENCQTVPSIELLSRLLPDYHTISAACVLPTQTQHIKSKQFPAIQRLTGTQATHNCSKCSSAGCYSTGRDHHSKQDGNRQGTAGPARRIERP
jgi:hypothetical protein